MIGVSMLYHIFLCFKKIFPFCNVVHYISFRAIGALLTSLLISLGLGSRFIAFSKQGFRAQSREFTPEGHRAKDNTPTMGGLLMLFAVLLSSVCWCDWSQATLWIFSACLVSFGAIGFWDDWQKIVRKKGIASKTKFLAQISAAALVMTLLMWHGISTQLSFPFFKNINPDLGWLFIPWGIFILVGVSNAVNLTDGLDGLAIGSLIGNFGTFSAIAYLAGHAVIAHYLQIPFAASSEVAIVGSALVGASIGFLWYNTYPAQIFMGDVGSLALGAALALMALMAKQELLLPLAGGLFVAEALSVILQVLSFKLTGKRIFKMAPLHHHFELIGWPEAKITVRFGIITLILCLLTLMTLKLR
jgi:phospho-N-acetylmuramoyl-pentapeptide-transferase